VRWEVVELAFELTNDLGADMGAVGKTASYLGELANLPRRPRRPKTAKHSHLSQVTPSHAK
jgi:hypothetical protein